MLNAIEAKKYATKQELSDTAKFRAHCEEKILEACRNRMQWCLVPTRNYTIGAKIHVFRELIHVYGYSVSQRNNEEGNCLYIKWGHAHDSVSEDKQED